MNPWINVKERLPMYSTEPGGASTDAVWAVIIDDKISRWGRGNIGTDGEWYRGGISLADIPTHWMYLPEVEKEYIFPWAVDLYYVPGNRVTYQGKLLELQEVMIHGKMIQAFVEVEE